MKKIENNWKRGRKLNNLREALFTYRSLMIDIGTEDPLTLRSNRLWSLAIAYEDKIVKKWGKK